MAGLLNKILLIGRLGSNPEVRSTSTGLDVANFSIATDESYTANNGDKIQKTEWHKIVAWGRQAEFVANYLHKGSLVYIEGKIETRKWKDQAGTDRYTTEIKADRVLGLDKKSDDIISRPDGNPDSKNSVGPLDWPEGKTGPGNIDEKKSNGFPQESSQMDEPPF